MASLQQLQDEVCGWLNRKDIVPLMPGWVLAVETEIAETLRARCMVTSGIQSITAPEISLPFDFASMESMCDAVTGEMLDLKDAWTGHWIEAYQPSAWNVYQQQVSGPCTAYRLKHDCVEFLPHPIIPNPPDPAWQPQQVLMGYYAKPRPLLLPSDTNPILEQLYPVYLFGVLKYGAMFERDDEDVPKWDAQWQQVVTRANLWKQQSDYSGAPLRAEMAVRF